MQAMNSGIPLPPTVPALQMADTVYMNPPQSEGSVYLGLVTDGAKPDVTLSEDKNKDLLLLLRKIKPLPLGTAKPQERRDYTIFLVKAGGKDALLYQRQALYFYWSRSGIIQEAQYKQDFSWGVVSEEFRVKINALLVKRRREIEAAHGVAPSPRPSAPVSQDGLPLPHPL